MDEVDLGEAPVALPHAEPMSLAARLRAGKLAVKEKRKHFSAVAESDTFLEDPGAWEKAQERLESTHQWVRGELDDVPLTPGLICTPWKRSVFDAKSKPITRTAWRVKNEDGSPGKVLFGVSDARKWAASFRLKRGPLPVAAAALLGPPLSASQERAQHCGLLAHAVPAYDQATAARDARKVAAHHALVNPDAVPAPRYQQAASGHYASQMVCVASGVLTLLAPIPKDFPCRCLRKFKREFWFLVSHVWSWPT
jgi:hypothetical protein